MPKKSLAFEEQLEKLKSRGLIIEDDAAAILFLSHYNYYRLSGYFKYWQINPKKRKNDFHQGASLSQIRQLVYAEQALLNRCDLMLKQIESVLRTRYAYFFSKIIDDKGLFANENGFIDFISYSRKTASALLNNLNSSEEDFISHHRLEQHKKFDRYMEKAYMNTPIWAAVEVLSFNTVVKLIADSSRVEKMLSAIHKSLNISKNRFIQQIALFVYLRNRIAHNARVWNVQVPEDKSYKMKEHTSAYAKTNQEYTADSMYQILLAIDNFASCAGLEKNWLKNQIEPLLKANPLLAQGICAPKEAGKISIMDILLQSPTSSAQPSSEKAQTLSNISKDTSEVVTKTVNSQELNNTTSTPSNSTQSTPSGSNQTVISAKPAPPKTQVKTIFQVEQEAFSKIINHSNITCLENDLIFQQLCNKFMGKNPSHNDI